MLLKLRNANDSGNLIINTNHVISMISEKSKIRNKVNTAICFTTGIADAVFCNETIEEIFLQIYPPDNRSRLIDEYFNEISALKEENEKLKNLLKDKQ